MAERRPLIAANWKMNTTVPEGVELARALRERLSGVGGDVVLCPPFTHLVPVRDCLSGSSLLVGAQDLFWEAKGAYTGEISAPMLSGLAQYVIVGHSERRTLFGETDADVSRKLRAALTAGLLPILCVGETAAERDDMLTDAVLRQQLGDALAGLELPAGFAVAYEPVWAIGAGTPATAEQAQESIAFIRGQLQGLAGAVAAQLRILYGGSVTSDNIAEFMREPDIDGALVGGASLQVDSFVAIVTQGCAARAG